VNVREWGKEMGGRRVRGREGGEHV